MRPKDCFKILMYMLQSIFLTIVNAHCRQLSTTISSKILQLRDLSLQWRIHAQIIRSVRKH